MFRFAHIDFLWLLLLIPFFTGIFILVTRRKRRQIKQLGDDALVQQLMPNASHIRPIVKFCIEMVALCLLIFALARPQWGQSEEVQKKEGIEVMIALDISNSMLAEDVTPNRLDRAKQMLSKLIDKMDNDKVGLIVFAGDAFVQLPITCDYISAKMFLQQITPDLIQTQGTAIGKAIKTCKNAFGAPSEASRVIIVITDGENHEDDAAEAAKQAHEEGIDIIVVGVGTSKGALIPIPNSNSYHKDRQGNNVVTKLNEQMCQEIAAAGGGLYVHCDNTNTATRTIENELKKLSTAEFETKTMVKYNEQYQSFVLLALLLLIIDFFIFTRKNKFFSKINLFERHK